MDELTKMAKFYQVSQCKYLGPVRFRSILNVIGENVGEIFQMTDEEMLKIPGVTKQVLKGIRESTISFEDCCVFMEKQINLARKCGGGIVTIDNQIYPQFIKKSTMCHPILYYKGCIEKFTIYRKSISIVGSRNAVIDSLDITKKTSYELSKSGWIITSGMALGIDSAAHKGSLEASGLTIAILGCGPDVVYPSKSQTLYDSICSKGVILSEFPFSTKVEDWKLQKRNKTIVGASMGAFVVESSEKGGAMNAVRACKEQKKKIFTLSPNLPFLESNKGNIKIIDEFNGIMLEPDNTVKVIEHELVLEN